MLLYTKFISNFPYYSLFTSNCHNYSFILFILYMICAAVSNFKIVFWIGERGRMFTNDVY